MASLDNEYGTVIRVDNYTQAPPTHEILSASSPSHVLQFCRTMTLAQGRVLYEVWDDNHTQGLHWLTPHLYRTWSHRTSWPKREICPAGIAGRTGRCCSRA